MDDPDFQAIIAEAQGLTAAANEEPAAEESAAEEPVTAEEVAEVVDAEESAAEEGDTPDEAADDEEPAPESESDTLDQLDDIPTNETLLATHKRVPQETKDALVSLADRAREEREVLAPIGGREGAKILAPIAALLQKSDITEDDAAEAWGALINSGNSQAGFRLLYDGAKNLLFSKDPQFREMAVFGDSVLEDRFGKGFNAERLEKLANLEKAGYISADEDYQTLQAEGKDSTLFQTQQTQLEEADAKIKDLERLIANPSLIEQRTQVQSNSVKDFETALQTRISERATPFRESVKWAEDSPLTKLVTKAILSDLKSDPDYQEALAFVTKDGFKSDSIPFPVGTKLHSLTEKFAARFIEERNAVQKAFRSIAETSRNAEVEKTVKEQVKPKAAEIAKPRTNGALDMYPELKELFA